MKGCKCSLYYRLCGDGCSVCNPEMSRRYEEETIQEMFLAWINDTLNEREWD
jgi:hypothetical protein